MSEEGSPSLLNLRDFRIQKKPTLSHNSDTNASETERGERKVIIRRRIINPFSDSDSECEQTSKKVEFVQTNTGNKRNMKNPSILEKEKQMKFLLEIFPSLEAMVIHDVLSKHSFNTDAAAAELSKVHNQSQMPSQCYSAWKQNYDERQNKSGEINNVIKYQQQQMNQSVSYQNYQLPKSRTYENGQSHVEGEFKRKASDVEVMPKKKKARRRRSSEDSDDSLGSLKDFKDTRVFDSDEDSDVEISNELTGDKKKVLEFFETATLNELQLMQSCSKKKAEFIFECRPFNGWIDLVEKLQSNKNLSTDLLNAAQHVLATRNNMRALMRKCSNIAQALERAVAAGAGVKMQPRNLSSALKLTSYQMVGLNWLVVMFNQGVNGILADEMGLGKTVQVISFLAHLKEIGAARNTHLVIVPSSTLDNWRSEFARWCPELRVFMYYGSTEERRGFRFDLAKGMLADFDVILTTYTIVANTPEERRMFRATPMHYVVFDEAHMLKNMNTQRYENLIRINAKHRILLTGTPLQNNLLELMSLLIFVMPKIFSEKVDDLKNLFQKNSKNKQEDDTLPAFEREQIEQAKRIMKPFVLRRLKCDVLQDLPKKSDHVVLVPLVPTQKQQYKDLVESFQNANAENGYNGMSMMSDLRKLSNHPLLLRYNYGLDKIAAMAKILANDPNYKDTKVEYIVEDLSWMSDFEIHTMAKNFRTLNKFILPDSLLTVSGKFRRLDEMLPDLKSNGHRVLIFSQYVIMLNVMEEYLRVRGHTYLRLDGSTAVNIRQQLINEYTEDRGIFIFLLSTKAGGLGINLTSADTVIIHDIDFNPYNDKQAEDRCHRMGQTKPVTVYRLISEGTIEEGMLQMNKEKLKLEREITTDETDNPDVKSVVRILSSALGIDQSKANSLVSPKKKT